MSRRRVLQQGIEATSAKRRKTEDLTAVAAPIVSESSSSAASTAALPTTSDQGELVFEDFPDFRPNLTPKQIIQAGSFGGGYFRQIKSSITGLVHKDDWREFPADWFEGVDIGERVTKAHYTPSANRYGVKCGQSLEVWEQKKWIVAQDPRGWFQWYCRFYLGRRTSDDARQVARWSAIAGSKGGRWRKNLIGKIVASGKPYDDASVSPVVRQTLLHWAYELTQPDFDQFAQ